VPPVPGQAAQPPGPSKPAPQPSAPPTVEEPTPAPPAEAAGPAEGAAPEQPEPSPEPTRQRSERANAPAPADDPALGRYVREIQKMGARALDDRQVPEAARAKGWSGTAQIEVRFAEGGYIRSIVLAQSSGRAEFDAHALAIARGIMFPHVPKELASRDFSARFAIAYKARKPR
jgi:protein TonB